MEEHQELYNKYLQVKEELTKECKIQKETNEKYHTTELCKILSAKANEAYS